MVLILPMVIGALENVSQVSSKIPKGIRNKIKNNPSTELFISARILRSVLESDKLAMIDIKL